MIANTNSQKWKLEEDQITLDYGNGSSATPPLKVNENTLTQTSTITVNGTNYSLTSTYVAQKIK